MDKEKGR
ncbi:hypothetical protein BIW11_13037 [Tropilaelaps mercedesae]|nr:hypothetical protein BIW11_13037 [Tropilaelaps mercedesae]